MRKRLAHVTLRVILIGTALSGKIAFSQDECLGCHEAIDDTNVVLVQQGIHYASGISCVGCHGGDATKEDMEEAMSEAAGFIGVPAGDDVSNVCAKCHASAAIMVKQYNSPLSVDQMELLSSSVHGQLSTTGRERIAQCTTCHGAHGIVRSGDAASPVHALNVPKTCAACHSSAAYMHSYDPSLPIDQLEKYRRSNHGRWNANGDARAADCADCHGSHEVFSAADVRSRVYATNIPSTCGSCHADAQYMKGYGIPSDQLAKYSESVHGEALLEKNDVGAPSCNDCHGNHGATPPGVESISKVCGTCHALNAELFSVSPHKDAFDRQKLPECETCHGYHDIVVASDKLLGIGQDAVCSWCHGDDPDSKGYRTAAMMRQRIDSLESMEGMAAARVNEAEQKGMEVSEAEFQLRSVREARLETRTKVHSFDEEQFLQAVGKGLETASVVSVMAKQAIDEYYFRRWGLGIATLIITSLAVSMYLLIRRIERAQAAEKHTAGKQTEPSA
jgi:hypothetical protein